MARTQDVIDRALMRGHDAGTRRLQRFGEDTIAEFDRSGAAGVERQVINAAGSRDSADVERIGEAASDMAQRSFDTAQGTARRQQRALGRNITDRERRVQRRRFGLARAASDVDARNRALTADQQRREAARVSAGSLRDLIDDAALTGLSTAAQAETAREQEFIRRKAQHEKEKAAGLGTIAGIATSFIPGGALFAPAVKGAVTKAAS